LKFLLDTHTLLWIINDDPQLPKYVKTIYLDEENLPYLSMASVWELSIKVGLGKLKIPGDLANFVNEHVLGNNIEIFPIQLLHLYQLQHLEYIHKDPFDRLLIAQAIVEQIPIMSADLLFDRYPIKRIWK
jgi:PIN domain nuclease of toxin-antitoxin system